MIFKKTIGLRAPSKCNIAINLINELYSGLMKFNMPNNILIITSSMQFPLAKTNNSIFFISSYLLFNGGNKNRRNLFLNILFLPSGYCIMNLKLKLQMDF